MELFIILTAVGIGISNEAPPQTDEACRASTG